MPSDEGNWKYCEELTGITCWQGKKLILFYCYGLKILIQNNIIMGSYDKMKIIADKNFNVKLNQFLNILDSFKVLRDGHFKINYQVNTCLDLYDFSNLLECMTAKLRYYFFSNELLYLRFFCSMILLKTVPKFESREKK